MRVKKLVTVGALVGALAVSGAGVVAAAPGDPASPAVTDGYENIPNGMTVSGGTSVVAGQAVTVTVAAPSGTPVTLTITWNSDAPASAVQIAGAQALTKVASGGKAVFSVTFGAPGSYTLTATDPAGNVLGSSTVSVAGKGGPHLPDTNRPKPGGGWHWIPGHRPGSGGNPGAGHHGKDKSAASKDGTVAAAQPAGVFGSAMPVTGPEAAIYGSGALLLIAGGTVLAVNKRRAADM